MSINANAGSAILAVSTGTGVVNWLSQVDLIISIGVGILSAVGIVYSIIWHRVRIRKAADSAVEKDGSSAGGSAGSSSDHVMEK